MNFLFNENKLHNKKLAVAVSGGKDSMALLHYLYTNKEALMLKKLAVVNVEHGIRGEKSVNDSDFVKSYCEMLNITCHSFSVDVKKEQVILGASEEETARTLRYNCFYNLLDSGDYDYVATAHHKSDYVESVFINIIRGTALKGLGGIPFETEKGVIRPLLFTDKADIDAYVNNNKIPFVTDETNLSDDYTRNFLRLNVLPLIKSRFNGFEDNVIRLSDTAKKEDAFLDNLAKNIIKYADGCCFLPINIDEVLFLRATAIALKSLGLKKDYEKKHLSSVYELVNSQNGTTIDLPKNICAVKEYQNVRIYKKDDLEQEFIQPLLEGTFDFNGNTLRIKRVNAKELPDNFEGNAHFIDADKLPKSAVVRTRRNGDVFKPFKGGSKKLKDFFIDKKIPVVKRNGILLIADENSVYYVGGMEISDKIKVDKTTQNVLQLTYITKEK